MDFYPGEAVNSLDKVQVADQPTGVNQHIVQSEQVSGWLGVGQGPVRGQSGAGKGPVRGLSLLTDSLRALCTASSLSLVKYDT